MTLGKYLILMIFGSVLCLLALMLVVFLIDPGESGALGMVFFYLSLSLFLIGFFTTAGLILRIKFKIKEIIDDEIIISFRQAILFSLLLVGALFFLARDWLTWWNSLILIALLAAVEFFYSSYQSN